MEHIQFMDLTVFNTAILFLIGFAGGVISGFMGSSGAFVLTPAMMGMGIPGIIAVASNMAHKFPKALEGAYKRSKYGQVDIKLGLIMGGFALIGVFIGKLIMERIQTHFGQAGSDLYVSSIFVLALIIVGGFVLVDGLLQKRGQGRFKPSDEEKQHNAMIRFVHGLNVPGTMLSFRSLDTKISLLVLAPIGIITGILAMTIAVGGFVGVPAMMYVVGLSAMIASATELLIASIVGIGGSLLYALDGLVDIRLSMIILAGSYFGIQIGSTSATYAKDHVVKFIMAAVMLLALASRLFYIPGYLSQVHFLLHIDQSTRQTLDNLGSDAMFLALFLGTVAILQVLYSGMRERQLIEEVTETGDWGDTHSSSTDDGIQLSPLARFERFLVASDGSEFSAAAVREAIGMARQCKAELHLMSLVAVGLEYEALGENVLKRELDKAQAHLDTVKAQALEAGVTICETHLIHGQAVHQEIVMLAERLKVDVIVMGRRGRRGLARMMLGHATALVIGKAHCSVLVVPRAAKIQGRHILVATDGSRFGDAASLTATRLGVIYEAPVTVVSVTSPNQSDDRRAEAWYAVGRAAGHMHDQGIVVDTRTIEGQPAIVITELAKECNTDLIITGSHGRTGLDRVLIGSTSERVLNATPCAVLVVKSA